MSTYFGPGSMLVLLGRMMSGSPRVSWKLVEGGRGGVRSPAFDSADKRPYKRASTLRLASQLSDSARTRGGGNHVIAGRLLNENHLGKAPPGRRGKGGGRGEGGRRLTSRLQAASERSWRSKCEGDGHLPVLCLRRTLEIMSGIL